MKSRILKERMMRSSILAGVAVSMVSVATPAFAQEDGVEEIFVTGSRIGRSDLTSALPVSVYDAEDIALSGEGTLENFVQSIPSVNGYMRGSGINNGTDGRATISLRGLGAGRTLVLINGRRPAPTGTGGEVDLNNIPSSIIERVEVLRDGASTIYGSDAIGGVVNLITKSNFEGAEIVLQHDVSDENDGKQYKAAMTIGGNVGRGNIVLNAEYSRRDVINQGDRPFSNCPLKESGGALVCGGSGTAYPGQFWAVGTHIIDGPNTDIAGGDGLSQAGGAPALFGVANQYNYAAKSILVTPQEVYSINGFANYDLLEDTWFGDVRGILEASFTERQSNQLLAPVGTFWGPEITMANLEAINGWAPAGVESLAWQAQVMGITGDTLVDFPAGVDSIFVARRLAESGGRGSDQHVQSFRIVAGLEGEWDNGWTWDVSYNHGSWTNMPLRKGFINQPRVQSLFDPVACADLGCPGLWNPLVTDSLTDEMIAFISTDYSNVNKAKQTIFNANIAGSFEDFLLLDGDIGWAMGIEHRKAKANSTPDAAAALGQIYGVGAEVTDGKYDVSEFYAEVNLPILSGREYAESLSIDFSGRWSEYSTAGNASNWKVGGEYAPTEDIRIRASYNTGLRAPGIGEMFAPQTQSAQSYVDPCLNYGALGAEFATRIANCAADGLVPAFVLGSNQATSLLGGNPDLKPEESEAFTVGVVLTPSMFPDWTATVDYFDYEITDAIGTAGTDNVITGCYDSVGFSSPLCALMIGPAAVGDTPGANGIYRDVFKTISGVLLTNANLGTYETSGVDFSVNYSHDVPAEWAGGFDLGEFNAGLSGTVIETYQYTAFAGAGVTDLKGTFGEDPWEVGSAAFPEIRMNMQAGFTTDLWKATWTGRYMSSVDDFAPCSGLACSADSMFYHDLQASMFLEDGMYTLTFGVRNVADLEPPYVTNYDDMNTIQASYDTQGRYYYLRAVASF